MNDYQRIQNILIEQLWDYNRAINCFEPVAYIVIKADLSKLWLEALPAKYGDSRIAIDVKQKLPVSPGVRYFLSFIFGPDKPGLKKPPLYLINPHQDGPAVEPGPVS